MKTWRHRLLVAAVGLAIFGLALPWGVLAQGGGSTGNSRGKALVPAGRSPLPQPGERFERPIPYDLLVANLSALRSEGKQNLVHRDAEVHPDARLTESVVARDVTIETPVSMQRCVVLPDTVISTHEPLDRVVVTPDALVDCRFWIDSNGTLVKTKTRNRGSSVAGTRQA